MSASTVSTLKWALLLLGAYAVGAVIAHATRGRKGLVRFSATVVMMFVPPTAGAIITSRIVPGYEEDRWLVWWLSITIFGYAVAAFIRLWVLGTWGPARGTTLGRQEPDEN